LNRRHLWTFAPPDTCWCWSPLCAFPRLKRPFWRFFEKQNPKKSTNGILCLGTKLWKRTPELGSILMLWKGDHLLFFKQIHNVPPPYYNGYVKSRLEDYFFWWTLVIWQPPNTRWWRDTDTTLRIHVRDILLQHPNIWLLKSPKSGGTSQG